MNKNIVICDLDGTLADIAHRRHFVENGNKKWKEFFAACVDDAPIDQVISAVDALKRIENLEVWVVSGRSDEVIDQTIKWLNVHATYDKLIMRKAGNYTPDDILKENWLIDGTIPKDRIFCVFDDRDRVVKMWRKHGLVCFQVAEGDF
jgi:hypothetical protein